MAKSGKKESGAQQPASQNGSGPGTGKTGGKRRPPKAQKAAVEVIEVTAEAPAVVEVGGDEADELRDALADAAALRDELRAAREEVAALKTLASTTAAEVGELRQLCKLTGENLVTEFGDQSLALSPSAASAGTGGRTGAGQRPGRHPRPPR